MTYVGIGVMVDYDNAYIAAILIVLGLDLATRTKLVWEPWLT